jgi:hypothetical protein
VLVAGLKACTTAAGADSSVLRTAAAQAFRPASGTTRSTTIRRTNKHSLVGVVSFLMALVNVLVLIMVFLAIQKVKRAES